MKTRIVGDLNIGNIIRIESRFVASDYMGKGEPKLPRVITLRYVGRKISKYSRFNTFNFVDDFGHEFTLSDGLAVNRNRIYWNSRVSR